MKKVVIHHNAFRHRRTHAIMSKLVSRLIRITVTITQHQDEWVDEYHKRTGLLKSEIHRRALDEFREREEAKEERKIFTSEQWRDIKEMARNTGKSAIAVARRAIDRERNRFFRRYK